MSFLWWTGILIIVLLAVLFSAIGAMLWSLAKRGDERSILIRTKAMSAAFVWTVVLLVLETERRAAFDETGTNPLLLLMLASCIFLVSLVIYKRKYGDLG